MARDDDDRRVPGARGPHGATRSGSPESTRDLSVRDRFSRGDGPQEFEDLSLERRDLERERDVPQVPFSRVDVLEDPRQIRVVGSGGLRRRLPSESHRGDAIPQNFKLAVQPKSATEFELASKHPPASSPGTNRANRYHRATTRMLRPVQLRPKG